MPLIVIGSPAFPPVLLDDYVASVVKPITGTEAAAVAEPFAPTVWGPPEDTGTGNVEPQLPLASAFDAVPCGWLSKRITMLLSLAPKPVPVTATEVPLGPFPLLVDMIGVTIKGTAVTVATVVVGPKAVTLCAPENVAAGTLKLADHEPLPSATAVPTFVVPSHDIVMFSLAPRPEPRK